MNEYYYFAGTVNNTTEKYGEPQNDVYSKTITVTQLKFQCQAYIYISWGTYYNTYKGDTYS